RENGQGSWLLESCDCKSWTSETGKTLLCTGMPGAGKTVMSSIVIKDLRDTLKGDSRVGIACLFCNYKEREQQTAAELLAGLVKQLVRRLTTLPTTVEELYTTHTESETRPTMDDLSDALQSIADKFDRVYFIIDALDECEDSNRSRESLLNAVFSLQ